MDVEEGTKNVTLAAAALAVALSALPRQPQVPLPFSSSPAAQTTGGYIFIPPRVPGVGCNIESAAENYQLHFDQPTLIAIFKKAQSEAHAQFEVQETVAERFRRLAGEWSKEVGNISSLTAMVAHPKYRQIVDLKWDVVPLMLVDLQKNGGFWFPALKEITGIQPFDPSEAGNGKRMSEAWVQWGKRKKLI